MIDHAISRADAPLLARIHQRAFPDFFLARLGEPFLIQFYLGFVDDPSAVVVVARDSQGRPQGVAVGTTDPVGFFGRLLRRRFLGFVAASLRAAFRNPRFVPRLLGAVAYRGDNPDGRQGALLSSICVDSSHSGRGLGSTLLKSWAQRAAEMGAPHAFLTTDAEGNDVVNAWYLREGWVLSDAFVTSEGRAMNRYAYDLAAAGGPQ